MAKAPPKGLAHQVEPEFAPPTQPRAHKKRAYHETTAADVEMRNGSSPNDRAIKQPRRSGGFGVRTAANDSHYGHGAPSQDPSHKFPPTAFPPGPGNPVQADYSGGFQGAVTASGPGSAVPPSFSSNLPPRPYGPPPTTRKKRQRCRDFDNKGFCARGNSCQYDHGSESIYLPSAPANGPEGMTYCISFRLCDPSPFLMTTIFFMREQFAMNLPITIRLTSEILRRYDLMI